MRPLSRLPRLVVVLLLLLAAAPAPGSTAAPPLEKVGILPIAVVPQPLEGAAAPANQDGILRRLVEEATARAERTLRRQKMAKVVERLSLPVVAGQPAKPAAAMAPVCLTGTVRLPIALPPHLDGFRRWYRHGRFASADVQLLRADGSTIARAEAILDWSDVRWFSGTGRSRFSRPLDDVLVEFVRTAADRAVRNLKRQRLELPVHAE